LLNKVLSISVISLNLSKLLSTDDWIVDTGASDHMTGSLHGLLDYKRCDGSIKVTMADGTISCAKGEVHYT